MHINWSTILHRLLKRSTPLEDKLLEKWMEENEQNQKYYQKAQRYFDLYYTGEKSREINMEEAWQEFLCHVDKSDRRRKVKQLFKYAACIVLLLGISVFYWGRKQKGIDPLAQIVAEPIRPAETKAILVFSSGDQINLTDSSILEQEIEKKCIERKKEPKSADVENYNTIIVPRGGEYRVVLADGTVVRLNADSKLKFPNEFVGQNRKVYLEGEALFEVTTDTLHPFVVKIRDGEVRVLGTLFNLNAYADEKIVQTTLVEGKVAFQGNGMCAECVISPGEQIIYHIETRKKCVKKVNTEIYTAWSKGTWIIEGERLETILKQLERWYDVTVFYQNPEAKDLVFTGDLQKYSNCDVILDIISMTTNVEFVLKGREIIVKMK